MAKEPQWSRFGRLGREARGDSIQTATLFVTRDASGTPKNSPQPYSSTVIALVIPDDAVHLILSPTTDLRISEDPAMVSFDVILAGAKESLPVTLMSTVYLRRDAVDGVVYFRFAKV